MKPNQRAAMLMGRGSKRKRGPKENGRGLVSEPEEGALPSFSRSCCNRNRKKRRKTEVKVSSTPAVWLPCYYDPFVSCFWELAGLLISNIQTEVNSKPLMTYRASRSTG